MSDLTGPAQNRPVWSCRARVLAVMAPALGCSLIAVFTVIWLRLPEESKATFTAFQRVTLLALSAVVLWILYRMATVRVLVYDEALVVRNVFRSYRVAWQDIRALRLNAGDAWLQLFDQDGNRLGILAIQAADGPRAHDAAKHLAALARARGAGRSSE